MDPNRLARGFLRVILLTGSSLAPAEEPITLINAEDGTRTGNAGNPVAMGLYRMDGLGGPCVRLCRSPTTATGSPALSRDGKRVAFDGWRDDQGESFADAHLFTFEMSQPHEITDLGRAAMPSWAPNGVGLAYSSYRPRGVGVMDAGGGGRTSLDRSGWSAEWSPDGSRIAYSRRDDVIVHNVLTGEQKSLLGSDVLSLVWHGFAWSPDSQWVCVRASGADGDITLVVIRAEGDRREHRVISQRVPETMRLGLDTPIAWGGDGQRVMFPANNPEVGLAQLFTLDASGESAPEVVPNLPEDTHCTQPYWSPDGTILFVGTPTGGGAAFDD